MSDSSATRREQVFALLAQLDPQAPAKVAANLDALSDDFAEIVLGFAFADVVSRPAIDLRTREMLTVAALMAMGNVPGKLEFHIRAARKAFAARVGGADIARAQILAQEILNDPTKNQNPPL